MAMSLNFRIFSLQCHFVINWVGLFLSRLVMLFLKESFIFIWKLFSGFQVGPPEQTVEVSWLFFIVLLTLFYWNHKKRMYLKHMNHYISFLEYSINGTAYNGCSWPTTHWLSCSFSSHGLGKLNVFSQLITFD